jgi:hypothetical protein
MLEVWLKVLWPGLVLQRAKADRNFPKIQGGSMLNGSIVVGDAARRLTTQLSLERNELLSTYCLLSNARDGNANH